MKHVTIHHPQGHTIADYYCDTWELAMHILKLLLANFARPYETYEVKCSECGEAGI